MESLQDQISLTMGDHVESFDMDAIVTEIREKFGAVTDIDTIDSDDYWAIVRRHDKTT